MHGKTQHSIGGMLGRGETSADPAHVAGQLCVDGLQVEGRRVVHGGWNARAFERGLDRGAVLHFDGVLRPRAGALGQDARSGDGVFQERGVAVGDFGARGQFFVEDFEFGQQHGRLESVEAAVDADAGVAVAAFLAVIAEFFHGGGERAVVGEAGTAIAIAAEGLGRKEAGATDGAEISGVAAAVQRSETLCCVFDDGETVARRDGVDGVHLRRLAVEADGENRSGPRRDGGFDFLGVEVVADGLDVDEDGARAGEGDHFAGGEKGEGRGDDLVGRISATGAADLKGQQSEEKRVSSAGAADAVLRAEAGGETLLELGDFGAEDKALVLEDAADARVDMGGDATVLRFQVDKFHHCLLSRSGRRSGSSDDLAWSESLDLLLDLVAEEERPGHFMKLLRGSTGTDHGDGAVAEHAAHAWLGDFDGLHFVEEHLDGAAAGEARFDDDAARGDGHFRRIAADASGEEHDEPASQRAAPP